MRISVVTSLYKSGPYVKEFHQRMSAAVSMLTPDFEIIYVDDGSPDDSARLIKQLMTEFPKVQTKLVGLSRNFGHHPALMVGLEHSVGDFVFLIDCDLEEPPELIIECYKRLIDSEKEDPPIDIVYAVQVSRKGDATERVTGSLFYKIFNAISATKLPNDALMARIMTRRYADAVISNEERELFLDGVMSLVGFRQETVVARKSSKGTSTYTPVRKLSLAINAVTSFSDRPLLGIFILGLSISSLSFLGILYLVSRVFVFGSDYLVGWPSIMVTIWFFGGLILLSIGIVGLYLARVFIEVKHRPRIVREISSNF